MIQSTPEHRRLLREKFGLQGSDLRRLERALCTLCDFDTTIDSVLTQHGTSERARQDVTHALRWLVDGP